MERIYRPLLAAALCTAFGLSACQKSTETITPENGTTYSAASVISAAPADGPDWDPLVWNIQAGSLCYLAPGGEVIVLNTEPITGVLVEYFSLGTAPKRRHDASIPGCQDTALAYIPMASVAMMSGAKSPAPPLASNQR